MSTAASRSVLDWFRTWANTRLDVIGRTDITSNMNVPLNNDVRVQAAINYLAGIEADVWALVTPEWEAAWGPVANSLDWRTLMPANVAADFEAIMRGVETDSNVKLLLKTAIRTVGMLELAHVMGAD